MIKRFRFVTLSRFEEETWLISTLAFAFLSYHLDGHSAVVGNDRHCISWISVTALCPGSGFCTISLFRYPSIRIVLECS